MAASVCSSLFIFRRPARLLLFAFQNNHLQSISAVYTDQISSRAHGSMLVIASCFFAFLSPARTSISRENFGPWSHSFAGSLVGQSKMALLKMQFLYFLSCILACYQFEICMNFSVESALPFFCSLARFSDEFGDRVRHRW